MTLLEELYRRRVTNQMEDLCEHYDRLQRYSTQIKDFLQSLADKDSAARRAFLGTLMRHFPDTRAGAHAVWLDQALQILLGELNFDSFNVECIVQGRGPSTFARLIEMARCIREGDLPEGVAFTVPPDGVVISATTICSAVDDGTLVLDQALAVARASY